MLPAPTAERASRLSGAATALYAAMWLGLTVQGWSPIVEYDAIWWLQLPAASAERMTSRDLDLAEAVAAAGPVARPLLQVLYEEPRGIREQSVEIWQELVDAVEADGMPLEDERAFDDAHARLAVLYGESGDAAAARAAAARVLDPPELADALCAAYGCGPAAEDADLALRESGLSGWYLDRARIALARAEGRGADAEAVRTDLVARGRYWVLRTAAVAAVNFAVVVLGVALAVANLRRIRAVFSGAPGGAPWTLADGVGVFVRGDFWNRAYFVGLGALEEMPGAAAAFLASPVGQVLESWATLVAALPLLWLVKRHLLAPDDLSATAAFGLSPTGGALRRTLGVAAAAIAIDLAGTYALGWATWGLGIGSSWSEGFDEVLVWGSAAQAWMTTIDYVAWAPAFEELAFRGVLYYSLRRRLGSVAAAVSTSVFFSGLHFYTLPGFLMTLWSGFVWALAFERTRSLWPGVVAHAVYNGMYVLGIVLLYR